MTARIRLGSACGASWCSAALIVRTVVLLVAGAGVAAPAAAQIVPCGGIQDRGYKILVDDIFDAAGGVASPLMQSLIFRMSTNLEQLEVESGLPIKVVRCAKRRPSDPLRFQAASCRAAERATGRARGLGIDGEGDRRDGCGST